jgi:hypothetical protein
MASLHKRPPVQVRRLPIVENTHFEGTGTSRNAKWAILNINTVVEALLEVHAGKTWAEALQVAVPARKRRLS